MARQIGLKDIHIALPRDQGDEAGAVHMGETRPRGRHQERIRTVIEPTINSSK